MHTNTRFLLILFWSILLPAVFCSTTQARTIALVYDDSGSMLSGDRKKAQYANFAAQSLRSLLRKTDKLVAVMTDDKRLRIQEKFSLGDIRENWMPASQQANTRYQAVERAMQYLAEEQVSRGLLDKHTEDWLVILTDGAFEYGNGKYFADLPPNHSHVRKAKQNIEIFLSKTNRNIQVVFLLVGKKADRTMPNWWKQASREHVRLLAAPDAEGLLQSMDEIAAMIAGRDVEETDLTEQYNGYTFTSPFPLRRITILQQQIVRKKDTPDFRLVNGVTAPNGRDLTINSSDIYRDNTSNRAMTIHGRVIHAHDADRKILPPGTYTIKTNPKHSQPLRVLLEAAVDIEVTLTDAKGNVLVPDGMNRNELCAGEIVHTQVSFVSDGRKIHLTDKNTGDLVVNVWTNENEKQPVALRKSADGMHLGPAQCVVQPNEGALSVEARYAGYFHLKLVRNLMGKTDCPAALGITDHWTMTLPRTNSETMTFCEPDHTARVIGKQLPKRPEGTDIITSQGIPPGVRLDISHNGKTCSLTSATPSVIIPAIAGGDTLRFAFHTNKEFKGGATTVKLTFSPETSTHKWQTNSVTVNLQPEKRNISLETQPRQWEADKLALAQSSPFKIRIKAGSRSLTDAELDDWRLTASTPESVEFSVKKVGDTLLVQPEPPYPFLGACMACDGDVPVRFHARNIHSGEEATANATLTIAPAGWWSSCKNSLLWLVVILVFSGWFLILLGKNRFPKGAFIVEMYQEQPNPERRRGSTFLRAGFLSRYLLPVWHEQCTAGGMLFRATPSSSIQVKIPPKSLSSESSATIGGRPLKKNRKNVWHTIQTGRALTIKNQSIVRTYKYNPK